MQPSSMEKHGTEYGLDVLTLENQGRDSAIKCEETVSGVRGKPQGELIDENNGAGNYQGYGDKGKDLLLFKS